MVHELPEGEDVDPIPIREPTFEDAWANGELFMVQKREQTTVTGDPILLELDEQGNVDWDKTTGSEDFMLRSVRARDERVTGATCCSCQFMVAFGGLPCCHNIRVVDVKSYGIDVFQRILAGISNRWLKEAVDPSASKRREANLRATPDPNLMSAPRLRARQQLTRQDRVPILRAKCSAVLDLGSSSDRAFETVVLALDNLLLDLTEPPKPRSAALHAGINVSGGDGAEAVGGSATAAT